MKAMVLRQPRERLSLQDCALPALRQGQVLVEISACAVCRTDLHVVDGELSDPKLPLIPGHEIVGRVTTVGAAVTKFKTGDLVGVGCLVDSDHTCPNCQDGLEQLCPNQTLTFNSPDKHNTAPVTYGGYSESIVVDEHFVLAVPTNLSLAGVAPLLCAGITTYSPLKHWKCAPGKSVGVVGLGGDWYDLIRTDGQFVATVGDVVGHGIDAIGLMAQSSGATRAYASEGHDPAQILDQLNTLLCRTGMEGFATAVLLRLDPASGEVAYASAGHPHPLLCDAQGRVAVLDRAQGRLLGYAPGADYTCARVVLEPGATMVLYTDGLVERRGEAIGEGTARLADALAAARDDTLDRVADGIIRRCLTGRLTDDACLLAIRRL